MHKFNDNGALIQPEADEFREWIYVGQPLAPHDLNNGKATFPEFHTVYIAPVS